MNIEVTEKELDSLIEALEFHTTEINWTAEAVRPVEELLDRLISLKRLSHAQL